jgi:enterochelin esterase family protein
MPLHRLTDKPLALRLAGVAVALCLGALVSSSSPAPTGRVEALALESEALGGALPVTVYTPGTRPPEAGWPVLYLLHGLGGRGSDWVELGGIKATLDRLIQSKRIRPMMVVMPSAGSSWYVNSGAVGGPGDYEAAIGDDLPRAIEAHFPAASSPQWRAIAGVSMGGFGALRIALKRPEAYAAVASMSGAIWQNLPLAQTAATDLTYSEFRDQTYYHRVDAATILSGVNLPPEGTHFGKAFGAPFDPERFNRQNVFTLLSAQVAQGKALPPIFLTVGDHDSKNLWRGSFALYNTLQAERQKVEFRVTDGDHTWTLWKKSIEDTLLFVDENFGKGAGGAVADSGLKAAS